MLIYDMMIFCLNSELIIFNDFYLNFKMSVTAFWLNRLSEMLFLKKEFMLKECC